MRSNCFSQACVDYPLYPYQDHGYRALAAWKMDQPQGIFCHRVMWRKTALSVAQRYNRLTTDQDSMASSTSQYKYSRDILLQAREDSCRRLQTSSNDRRANNAQGLGQSLHVICDSGPVVCARTIEDHVAATEGRGGPDFRGGLDVLSEGGRVSDQVKSA